MATVVSNNNKSSWWGFVAVLVALCVSFGSLVRVALVVGVDVGTTSVCRRWDVGGGTVIIWLTSSSSSTLPSPFSWCVGITTRDLVAGRNRADEVLVEVGVRCGGSCDNWCVTERYRCGGVADAAAGDEEYGKKSSTSESRLRWGGRSGVDGGDGDDVVENWCDHQGGSRRIIPTPWTTVRTRVMDSKIAGGVRSKGEL